MDRCCICAGPLELRYRGTAVTPTPDGFAPAVHGRGMHGDLYRCLGCGTVQQPSLPAGDALHELYRQMSDVEYLCEEEGRRQTARRLLDLLSAYAGGRRLLDVGSSYGLMLDEARRRGYDALGVELSSAGVRHTRHALGAPVLEASLETVDLSPASFDAIVMTDVFEHLDDPVAALERCTELLAPGGVLLLTTPDPSSPTARLAGARWWSYLLAHRCLVPRATIRKLLTAHGLAIEGERPYVRVFTLGYWLAGFADRGGAAAVLAKALERVLPTRRLVGAAMHDEWTYIAVTASPRGAAAHGAPPEPRGPTAA
ncbi:MAG: class I SAM-dependent methyltransferase [Solirubrobacteraceae bacterium]